MKPKGALLKSIRHNTGSSAQDLVPFLLVKKQWILAFNKKAAGLIKIKIRW